MKPIFSDSHAGTFLIGRPGGQLRGPLKPLGTILLRADRGVSGGEQLGPRDTKRDDRLSGELIFCYNKLILWHNKSGRQMSAELL